MRILHKLLVLVAVLFGLATIFASSRVLLGADPGYSVYQPLLIYNAVMGVMYVLAGITAWRNVKRGMYAALTVLILNLLVLSVIYYLYTEEGPIALESLSAMILRSTVWLVLFNGFGWLSYRNKKT